jgi:hypothetical protein
MSGHTPGKWEVINGCDIFGLLGGDSGDGYLADSTDGWKICEVVSENTFSNGTQILLGQSVVEANARLIAAAPDMLDALEAILPWIPTTSAKEGCASAFSENVRAADKVRAAIAKATGDKA